MQKMRSLFNFGDSGRLRPCNVVVWQCASRGNHRDGAGRRRILQKIQKKVEKGLAFQKTISYNQNQAGEATPTKARLTSKKKTPEANSSPAPLKRKVF